MGKVGMEAASQYLFCAHSGRTRAFAGAALQPQTLHLKLSARGPMPIQRTCPKPKNPGLSPCYYGALALNRNPQVQCTWASSRAAVRP
jgi:hypothetical protein